MEEERRMWEWNSLLKGFTAGDSEDYPVALSGQENTKEGVYVLLG